MVKFITTLQKLQGLFFLLYSSICISVDDKVFIYQSEIILSDYEHGLDVQTFLNQSSKAINAGGINAKTLKAHLMLGVYALEANKRQEAKEHFTLSRGMAQRLRDMRYYNSTLLLTVSMFLLKDYVGAKSLLNDLIFDESELSAANLLYCEVLNELGRFKEAKVRLMDLLHIARKKTDYRYQIYINGVLAQIYAGNGLYKQSIRHYNEARQLLAQDRSYKDELFLYVAMAATFKSFNDFQRAISALKNALSLYAHSSNVLKKVRIILLLMDTLNVAHQYREAREYGPHVVGMAEQSGNRALYAEAVLLWGVSYFNEGLNDRAYNKLKSISSSEVLLLSDSKRAIFHNRIASLLAHKQDHEMALEHFELGLVLAEKSHLYGEVLYALEQLSEYYVRQKDYKQAFEQRLNYLKAFRKQFYLQIKEAKIEAALPYVEESLSLNEEIAALSQNLEDTVNKHQQREKALNRSFFSLAMLLSLTLVAALFIFLWMRNTILKKENELVSLYVKIEDFEKLDVVTGLLNRKTLEELAIQYEKNVIKTGSPLCIVTLAIDDYFDYVDNFGWHCGDSLLVTVARQIEQLTRSADISGRWNNEAIVLLLPDTKAQGALTVANKIKDTVKETLVDYFDNNTKVEKNLHLSISACVCEYEGVSKDIITCIESALYYLNDSLFQESNAVVLIEEEKQLDHWILQGMA